jgi:hypothetical protein
MASKNENCEICGQEITDDRHDHPHDYCGSIEVFNASQPCLSCGMVHRYQPYACSQYLDNCRRS